MDVIAISYVEHDVKPCPFCGSDNARVTVSDFVNVVICENCGAEGPMPEVDSSELAVKLWNQRS